ncbi:MAG: GNAT family N-acetyltransferase [Bacteroidota bacterium]
MEISFRKAGIGDLDLLQYWDTKPHVTACDPDEEWDWEGELSYDAPWREQWVAELDGRPVGFVQIIDPAEEESHYWGDVGPQLRAIDIWIGEEDDLNRGYGTRIMQKAIRRCFSNAQVEAILIDPLASNVNAHRFYERLGFVFEQERTFGDQVCFVYRLTRSNFSSA